MIKFNGDIPSNVDIDANIREALNFKATHSILETYYYFYLKVKNKGEWD